MLQRNLIIELNNYTVQSPMMIMVKVTKDMKSESPDFAEITIYNLSENTRSGIVEDNTEVRIYGGYNDQKDLIFKGDIQFIVNTKAETEWITSITAGDGAVALKQKLLNKTYADGVDLFTIVRDASNALSGQEPEMLDVEFKSRPSRGITISETAADTLKKTAKDVGAYWSYQDGQVVVGTLGSKRRNVGYNININTGMVGGPEWMNTGQDYAQLQTLKGQRIRVKTLCLPSIKPYDGVHITSDKVQTRLTKTKLDHEFSVTRVEHDLNSREGDFQTTIEAVFNDE